MSRAVIEGCLPLDIRRLNREGWRFGWQTLSYTSGSSISFVGTREAITLSYRAGGQPVDEAISVVTSAMHFGGSREFLLCPGCRRRFAILYSVHGCPPRVGSEIFGRGRHESRGD